MPTKSYALWDQLGDRFAITPASCRRRDESRAARSAHRTQPYRQAAKRTATAEADYRFFAHVADDYRYLLANWDRLADQAAGDHLPTSSSDNTDGLILLLWIIGPAGLISMLAILAVSAWILSATGLAVLLFTPLIFRHRLHMRRCRKALRTKCCPDCDYSLKELPPAIPSKHLQGLISGPAQCPECGSPWPLVPCRSL